MSCIDVDIDCLIMLVQERPVLWDKTEEKYKDRNKTFQAWKEVFNQLKSDYADLDDKKKNEFGKEVMKKWKNLRDSYRKSLSKTKAAKKSGAGVQTIKTYIYESHLRFLDKIFQGRETEDTLTQNVDGDISDGMSEEDRTEEYKNGQEKSSRAKDEAGNKKKKPFKMPESKKRKIDPIEQEMLEAVRDKPNRHLSFFTGILPSLQDFDELEVLEFQMEVLKVVQTMKQRKLRNSSTGNSVPIHPPQMSTSLHQVLKHSSQYTALQPIHYSTAMQSPQYPIALQSNLRTQQQSVTGATLTADEYYNQANELLSQPGSSYNSPSSLSEDNTYDDSFDFSRSTV